MSYRVDLAETSIKKNMEEIKKIETSVDDDIEVKMDNIQQEILERKKKKRNVIIFGAEESKKICNGEKK